MQASLFERQLCEGEAGYSKAASPQPDAYEEAISVIRLARSRNVGPITYRRLIARYGSPANALDHLPELAGRGGETRYQICSHSQAEREWEAGTSISAKLLVAGGSYYPPLLALIDDAPPFLWAKGRPELIASPHPDKTSVAIVGARYASAMGQRFAAHLAESLAKKGFPIISGLARGIDTAAHQGALAADGETIAVCAGGVDIAYPPANAKLMEEIAQKGLVLSEAPPGLEPQARHFPRRNRLISGLSHAVVLIEAAERSGSLGTAAFAAEQGREVLCVPGGPMDARAAGCNRLIREGCALVRGAADVLEAVRFVEERLHHEIRAMETDNQPDQGETVSKSGSLQQPAATFERGTRRGEPMVKAEELFALLGDSPISEDQLARAIHGQKEGFAEALLQLELAGRLIRENCGRVMRAYS